MRIFIVILMLAGCVMAGETPYYSSTAKATKDGLTDIQSCKTNLVDALDRIQLAIDEAQALPASATKTALVDLAKATKQLAQATRDAMQAIKKMNKDNSP